MEGQSDIENFEKMVRTVMSKLDELEESFKQIQGSIESLEAKMLKDDKETTK